MGACMVPERLAGLTCTLASTWLRAGRRGSSPHAGVRLSDNRQFEREYRAAAELAGDADNAVVGFHDGFGDGQSHARALHTIALVAAAVELVEDQRLFKVVDAVSVIGDA